MSDANKNHCSAYTDMPVRERLLDVAEELFCEHGFDGTSIRDLATAADCNIASVNYYFGGKENLYTELWRRRLRIIREIRLASIEKVMSKTSGNLNLEELLEAFADSFLEPLLNKEKSAVLLKLMSREMLDRRLSSDMFINEIVTPTVSAMQNALIKICPKLDKSKVPFIIFSIIGQLVQIIHLKTMFEQSDRKEMPQFEIPEIIKHIVRFSAAAIRAYENKKNDG